MFKIWSKISIGAILVCSGVIYAQTGDTRNTKDNSSKVSSVKAYSESYKQMIDTVVAQNYNSVASKNLTTYFPSKYFDITTTVTFKKYPAKLPYTSEMSFLNTLKRMPILSLKKYMDTVSIKVFVADNISPESYDQVTNLVRKSLLLNSTDAVDIEKLALTFRSEDEDLKEEISKLQSEINAKTQEISAITRERNDSTMQLSTYKTNFEGELAKGIELENQLSLTKDKLSKLEIELKNAKDEIISFLDHPKVLMIVGVISLVLLALAAVFFLGFRGLSGSFAKVAESIVEISNALPEIGGSSSVEAGGAEVLSGESDNLKSLPAANDPGSDIRSVAELQGKVLEIQDNVLSKVDENNLESLISHISTMMTNKETFEIGIASMELLGPEMANKIFNLLGENQRKPIRRFLENSTYSQPKTVSLYNAGQSLLTFLSMGSMSNNFENKNPQVSLVISKLDKEDVLTLSHKLSENALSRFMLYSSQEMIVEITNYSEKSTGDQAEKCLKAIAKLSESVDDESLDGEIISTCEELLVEIGDDKHRQYMNLYAAIGNKLSDSMSTKLQGIMEVNSEKVGAYLKKEVLNVNTFYLVTVATQTEILSKLSNKDLCALTIDMEEDKKSVWIDSLSDRRKESIADLAETLKSQTVNNKKREIENARKSIKDIMSSLKFDDQLFFKGDQSDEQIAEEESVTAA